MVHYKVHHRVSNTSRSVTPEAFCKRVGTPPDIRTSRIIWRSTYQLLHRSEEDDLMGTCPQNVSHFWPNIAYGTLATRACSWTELTEVALTTLSKLILTHACDCCHQVGRQVSNWHVQAWCKGQPAQTAGIVPALSLVPWVCDNANGSDRVCLCGKALLLYRTFGAP